MSTKFVTVSVVVSNMGVVLIKHRSPSHDSVAIKCYYHVVYNNFVSQQDSALMHLAFNTDQLMQCKNSQFLNVVLLSGTHYLSKIL